MDLQREVTEILTAAGQERGKCDRGEFWLRVGSAVVGILIFQSGMVWAGLSIADRVVDDLVRESLIDPSCSGGDLDYKVGEVNNLIRRQGYSSAGHRQ